MASPSKLGSSIDDYTNFVTRKLEDLKRSLLEEHWQQLERCRAQAAAELGINASRESGFDERPEEDDSKSTMEIPAASPAGCPVSEQSSDGPKSSASKVRHNHSMYSMCSIDPCNSQIGSVGDELVDDFQDVDDLPESQSFQPGKSLSFANQAPTAVPANHCPCGAPFTDDSNYCRICGTGRHQKYSATPLEANRCKCGYFFTNDCNFCRVCGEPCRRDRDAKLREALLILKSCGLFLQPDLEDGQTEIASQAPTERRSVRSILGVNSARTSKRLSRASATRLSCTSAARLSCSSARSASKPILKRGSIDSVKSQSLQPLLTVPKRASLASSTSEAPLEDIPKTAIPVGEVPRDIEAELATAGSARRSTRRSQNEPGDAVMRSFSDPARSPSTSQNLQRLSAADHARISFLKPSSPSQGPTPQQFPLRAVGRQSEVSSLSSHDAPLHSPSLSPSADYANYNSARSSVFKINVPTKSDSGLPAELMPDPSHGRFSEISYWNRGGKFVIPDDSNHFRTGRPYQLSKAWDIYVRNPYEGPSRNASMCGKANGLTAGGFIQMDSLNSVVKGHVKFFEFQETLGVKILLWMTTTFWTLNVPLNFISGYTKSNGDDEIRPHAIARSYARTWMPIDVLTVSVDWLTLLPFGSNSDFLWVRAVRALRMIRLLRLARAPAKLELFVENVRSEKHILWIRTVGEMLMFVMFAHVIGCGWYGLGNASSSGWVVGVQTEHGDKDKSYFYAVSYHWALTNFASSMEVHPQNLLERIYAVSTLVVAFFLSVVLVSSLTSSMTQLQFIKSKQTAQAAALRRFLLETGISHHLKTRVQANASFNLNKKKKTVGEGDVELLEFVSAALLAELHFEMYFPVISQHPLFAVLGNFCPIAARQVCDNAVTKISVSRGDLLFSCGESPVKPKMIFVCHGQLVYTEESATSLSAPASRLHSLRPQASNLSKLCKKITDNSISSVSPSINSTSATAISDASKNSRLEKQKGSCFVSAGEWICEPVIWLDWIFDGNLAACMESDLLLLDADAFRDIVSKFRNLYELIGPYAQNYVNYLNRNGKASDFSTGKESSNVPAEFFLSHEEHTRHSMFSHGQRNSIPKSNSGRLRDWLSVNMNGNMNSSLVQEFRDIVPDEDAS